MKQYQETKEGNLTTDNMTIPAGHGLYRIAQEEVAAGEAVIIPFDHVAADAAQAIAEARAWRNSELAKADIEIYKLEDTGDDSTSYRAYRIALRDWPAFESFPDDAGKPTI
jgi:hypothetical protein